MTTKTKNTKSKIQQLPEDIRSQLAAMLRSGSMSQKAILEEVNQLILEAEIGRASCRERVYGLV